jgi:hypothetical protein
MSTVAAAPRSTALSGRNRQIVFAVAIVALFGAMWPYTEYLQKVKTRADLGEAAIGQIDEGSFLHKLAMIAGFRGVVANMLWMQAEELKREHEWDKLKSTVDMITKLQPHFLSVWTFQGWNLAYNVAAEWDAPEDKYVWIKNGINFLRDGVRKNRRSPDLIWDTAWTYYHKLGFADEAILLRRLFYDDRDEDTPDFKIDPITQETRDDNFQVAKGWFTRAVNLVDEGAQRAETAVTSSVEYVDKMPDRKGRPGDLNFRSMPAHAQTRYAIGLEKMSKKDIEPLFGDYAREAWNQAYLDWLDFGRYPFPAFRYEQFPVFIDDITNTERFYSSELNDVQRHWTGRWANDMNYRYWKDRADTERERQGVAARRLFYQGTLALRTADFPEARDRYKQGLDLWKELLERHPVYRDDSLNQKDTGELVRRYVYALRQAGDLGVDEPPPDDLPFKEHYESVKDDPFRDPFDQLDMMKITKEDKGASGTNRPAGR